MAKINVTKSEVGLLKRLRRLRSGLHVAPTSERVEGVATYELRGMTPAAFMRDNFGKPSMPEDEPDGEPTEQIMIEFED